LYDENTWYDHGYFVVYFIFASKGINEELRLTMADGSDAGGNSDPAANTREVSTMRQLVGV